ncbi:MAG: solanesyl diphosphate synthase, partial [Okeania sp. SIO2H7]|nr:solanesyl diphosphate synthase [Okeania sp. SIO2H7]
IEEAIALIKETKAIEQTRELAASYAKKAADHLQSLPDCDSREALINLADYVLSRLY